MSTEQRETLDAILRQSALPPDADVNEQRELLRAAISAQPLAADVTVTAAELGGVPTAEITVDGIEARHVVLYFHGGVYVMGDAALAADLASQVGRRTDAKVISVDYRLAPEHPYPAAVDDALAAYEALLDNGNAPSDIVLAGESAGGALAVATLATCSGSRRPGAASNGTPSTSTGSQTTGRSARSGPLTTWRPLPASWAPSRFRGRLDPGTRPFQPRDASTRVGSAGQEVVQRAGPPPRQRDLVVAA